MADKYGVEYTNSMSPNYTWIREFDSELEATTEVYLCNKHALALSGVCSYSVTAIYLGKIDKE